MPFLLVNVLENIAQLLWGNEPREPLSEGRLFLRFLGLNNHQVYGDEAWKLIQERIETVFGPKLLNWCMVGTVHRNERRQSRYIAKSQNFFASSDEEFSTSEESKFYAQVALLSLHIAAVNDNNEQLMGTLTTNLNAVHQEAIQNAFAFLIDNQSALTKEKLESLFTSFSPSSRSFNSNSSTYSTPYRATPSTSSLGESFTYSPTNPSPAQNSIVRESPLQSFLKTYHTQKVLNYCSIFALMFPESHEILRLSPILAENII